MCQWHGEFEPDEFRSALMHGFLLSGFDAPGASLELLARLGADFLVRLWLSPGVGIGALDLRLAQ